MISTVTNALLFLSAFTSIGLLLAAAVLVEDSQGSLSQLGLLLKKKAQIASGIWVITSALAIVNKVSEVLEVRLTQAFDLNTLRSFVTQIDLGKFMLAQSLAAFILYVSLTSLKRVLPALVLIGISLLGLIAPVFQSHAASSGSHGWAIGSLVTHVIALTLWVGGAIGLVAIPRELRRAAIKRFSPLALWAAIAVVISGFASALIRLTSQATWATSYGVVVFIKIVLTILLISLGYLNREYIAKGSDESWRAIARTLVGEVVVMAVATVLGSALANLTPPTQENTDISPSVLAIGIETPPKPSLINFFTLFSPDALFITLLVTALALYLKGIYLLHKRGDKWPIGRTISFIFGLLLINLATSGGFGLYALFSFEYHMIAHMQLGMIAPIFLVLGAPITLALRTLPIGRTPDERGLRSTLLAALHSRPAMALTNPITALALFDGSLFILYFTNLFGDLMQQHVGHLFMNIHFILAGFLFFHVIIGIDPNPRKIPHIVRIVLLFAAMALHAFFSVALMAETTLIDMGYYQSLHTSWLPNLLLDQQKGGSIGWAMGEIPILIALVATFIQWMRDDSREAKRIDRNEARLAAMGEPDDLAHYNAYLNKLHMRDESNKE